jgi:hypothetical protein
MPLTNASIRFDTTTDNLDDDTQLIVEGQDSLNRLAARYSGYPGEDGMESGQSKTLSIPIENRLATAEELVAGEVVIAIRPDDSGIFNLGHDTWKFNWSLVLEFDDRTPLNSGQVQGEKLTQDRNTVRVGLRGIIPVDDTFGLSPTLHPITIGTVVSYFFDRIEGVETDSTTVHTAELLRYASRTGDEEIKTATVSLRRGIDNRFNCSGRPYNRVGVTFRVRLGRPLASSDPRIEINTGILHTPDLPTTVDKINVNESVGSAEISFRPETIEPGTVLVFAANFESGQGGLIAQHQINVQRTFVISGGGVILSPSDPR